MQGEQSGRWRRGPLWGGLLEDSSAQQPTQLEDGEDGRVVSDALDAKCFRLGAVLIMPAECPKDGEVGQTHNGLVSALCDPGTPPLCPLSGDTLFLMAFSVAICLAELSPTALGVRVAARTFQADRGHKRHGCACP